MPKLLFIAPDAGFFVSHRLNLGVAAVEAGYEVTVASPPGKAVETIVGIGARHRSIALDRGSRNPFVELQTLLEIDSLVRDVRPDLVHLVSPKPVLYGGFVARLRSIPAVIAVSGLGYLFVSEAPLLKLLRKLVVLAYRFSVSAPKAHVIFQNPDDLAFFQEQRILRHTRFTLIPGSGVDLQKISAQPLLPGPVVVLLPARLLHDKGVTDFVAAAKIVKRSRPDAVFRLLGDPDLSNPTSVTSEELQQWTAEGVVEWRPYTRDMNAALAESHIVALPSYREGLPKTLIDAAAAGRAAVTNDVPGCRHAVVDGVTGFICEPKNVDQLASVLLRLIDDRGLQERTGRAARAHAEAHFDVNEVTATHMKLFRELSPSLGGGR